MTTKEKVVTGAVIVVGSGVTYWFVDKQIKKNRVAKMNRQTVDATSGVIDEILKNNLKVPPGERQLPSFNNAQYKSFADTLESAMDGGGTDEDPIEEIFGSLNNNLDVHLLVEAFGIRDDENLAKWLRGDGMTKPVNAILAIKGRITFRF